MRAIAVPLTAVFLVFALPPRSQARHRAKPAASRPSRNPADRAYAEGRRLYQALRASPPRARARWVAAADRFESVARRYPKSPRAPEALFTAAEILREAYRRRLQSADLDRAERDYRLLGDRYPAHRLADDALLRRADLDRVERHDPEGARKLLASLVARYPRGDRVDEARYWLRKTRTKSRGPGPAPPPVEVQRVECWSASGETRVVVTLSGEATFFSHLVPHDEGKSLPDRIVIDVEGARVSPHLEIPTAVAGGEVASVRVAQNRPNRVRVVLDTANFKDWGVYQWEGPFRIIVDVSGAAVEPPSAAPSPATSSEAPAPATPPAEGPAPEAGSPPAATEAVLSPPATAAPPEAEGRRDEASIETLLSGGEATAPEAATPAPYAIRKILVDPGHGGEDGGAVGRGGTREKTVVLQIARRLAEKIRKEMGIEASLTRDDDRFIPLEQRRQIARAQRADLFVSIHANSSRNRRAAGTTTYFLNRTRDLKAIQVAARENDTSADVMRDVQPILTDLQFTLKLNESPRLARFVQRSLVRRLRSRRLLEKDLGVRPAPFYVLVGRDDIPSILVETAFISNRHEEALLKDTRFQDETAEGIVEGLKTYVNEVETQGNE